MMCMMYMMYMMYMMIVDDILMPPTRQLVVTLMVPCFIIVSSLLHYYSTVDPV